MSQTDQENPIPDQEESSTVADTTALQAQIDKLESELKEAKEAAARANAESYNAQRRAEAEAEKAKKFALERFSRELLDVVDNLERAIEIGGDDAITEGVKLTHKALISTLEKHGITVINPQGEKFNADLHQAVGIDPEADTDTVGEVLQKGYQLHERLLRPAMVRVGQ